MLTLLRILDQLRRLMEYPGLIPAAMKEMLRFAPPVQADFPRVLADREVNRLSMCQRTTWPRFSARLSRAGKAGSYS